MFMGGKKSSGDFYIPIRIFIRISITGNDVYSGDRYSGNDRYSGLNINANPFPTKRAYF